MEIIGGFGADFLFLYAPFVQTFTAPTTGNWSIDAFGGQGGEANMADGGLGAEAAGILFLTAGEVLDIVTGGQGSGVLGDLLGGGGGGGSFVYSAAVPEPSTWVMMLAGFAGLGLAGARAARRRDRAAA